jgi:Ca-activated chloride channel homolog
MLELVWPWMILLLPLPWLVYRLLPSARSEQAALRAPFFQQWQALSQAGSAQQSRRHWLSLLMLCLVWLCLVAAATRPILYGDTVTLPMEGRDLLLAVDISGSMQIEDMRAGNNMVNRLIAVKAVVGEFVERRQGDRLGLVLFASRAYLQAPLTFDTQTVKRFLNEAQIGFAGSETAIGDAIGLSIKRLRERPSESRVMILLTDGANTAGAVNPLEAAKLAAENDIRIYTVGIGADQMTRAGIFGTSFGSRTVNPSRDLDEDTLMQIAELTSGQYFRARNPGELAEIYQLLDQLEPINQDSQTFRPQTSLFHWPLSIALILSLLLAASRSLRAN